MSKLNKEAVKEIRKLGFTYQAIGNIFGAYPSAIHRLINDESGEKYRKYNREQSRDYYSKEENRLFARERKRQSVLTVNGKYMEVNKRPRPDDICEVCSRTVS